MTLSLLDQRQLRPVSLLVGSLAILIFAAATFSLTETWTMPWPGIILDGPSRQVLEVELDSANRGQVLAGDVILEIAGKPLAAATPTYQGLSAGESVSYTLKRGSSVLTVDVLLEPPPARERIGRLIHLLLGFTFWLLGVVIFVHNPQERARQVFLLMCLAATSVLTLLDLSGVQTPWATYLSVLGILFSGATFVHLHTLFPQARSSRWRVVVGLLYGVAATLALLYVAGGIYSPSPLVATAIESYLLLSFTIGLLLLVDAWRTGDGSVRRRIRLVVAGTLLAITPLIVVLLSGGLSPTRTAPYEVGIASLVFIPLAYGYALYREDLHTSDILLYRLLVYLLLALSLFATYLTIVQVLSEVLPGSHQSPFTGGVASLVVAFAFAPLRRGIERLLNQLFYGAGYNYLQVLTPAIDRLSSLDREALIEVLTVHIPGALRVNQAALWLIDQDTLAAQWVGGDLELQDPAPFLQDTDYTEKLRKGQPVPVQRNLSLSGRAASRISPRWIIPLTLTNELQGIWLVGARGRDESFGPVDLRLMLVTAQSAALVIKVMTLLETLQLRLQQSQADRAELAAAYRRLTQVREDERQHLARELHDEALQSLVIFGMTLNELSESVTNEFANQLVSLQSQVQGTIARLRRVCQHLRPPALVNGGLNSGLRTLSNEMSETYGFRVYLDIALAGRLAEDLETTVYRIVQEALMNVGKHAGASQADVTLRVADGGETIELAVQDNGCGFNVQEVKGHRFGLVGLRERAIGLGGRLTVTSYVGGGTRIEARIPYKRTTA